MQRLKDKVCIVTGSGAGIGKEIAKLFAREGGKIVCASRRESNGKPVADEIVAEGGDAMFVLCDISDEESVKRLFHKTIVEYGRLDVLVNNAGVNFVKPFLDIGTDDWDRVMNTDLRGTFLCTQHAITEMLKVGGGSVVNITSVHTLAGMEGAAPYDAAKWGVVGMTKSLAVEFASRGIRVNALSPGLIATQIWDDIMEAAPDRQACIDYWNANIPAGRVGTPEEVAYAALFLAGDESRYFCGANILLDGGMTSQLVSRPGFESESLEGGQR
jgi:NAD(P)-dependent dehydrogenase (short-subunit alcohol dehydrogenase family)